MEQLFQGVNGELLYNAAAILSLSAYMLSNVLWLRILLVGASTIYVIAGLKLGITSMSAWNSAYLLINSFHAILLIMNKSSVLVDEEVRGLYLGTFSTLSSREFKKLISVNPIRSLNKSKILEEGERTNELFVILNGSVEVIKSDDVIAQLGQGDLIGEMSFMANQPASADVISDENTKVAYWTHQDLRDLKSRNNELYNKFISIIGCDLVKKLNKNNLHADYH